MVDQTAITKFLEHPRDFPNYIHETHDFDSGFEIIGYIHDMVRGADSILDIVIKAMEGEWKPEEHEGEQFYDAMVRRTPLAPVTIMRHTRVGQMMDLVPDEYRPQIESKDVRSKVALTDTVLSGYELQDEQWEKVANSQSYQDVAEVVREVKKVPPRSQWMKFTVDEHGIVWVHVPEGVVEYFRINPDPEVEDIIERANKRLFRRAGIVPKVTY